MYAICPIFLNYLNSSNRLSGNINSPLDIYIFCSKLKLIFLISYKVIFKKLEILLKLLFGDLKNFLKLQLTLINVKVTNYEGKNKYKINKLNMK